MAKRLYIGGLAYQTTERDLAVVFDEVGGYASVRIIVDRDTGRSKGFGFVEMATDELASDAIRRFDGMTLHGRRLTVSEARPQEQRPPFGFGGPRRNGFGGHRA